MDGASMFDQGDGIDWSAGIIPGTTGQADPDALGVAGSAGVAAGTGTGQHGVVPLDTGAGMGSALSEVWSTLNKPFATPYSAVDVTLIVGVILIAIILWSFVLYHVRLAAESI